MDEAHNVEDIALNSFSASIQKTDLEFVNT